MALALSIDKTSTTPPFEQLRMQLLAAVQDGRLPAGTRLPTVRGLATELGLAVNTVAGSYRALEKDGVIETRTAIEEKLVSRDWRAFEAK